MIMTATISSLLLFVVGVFTIGKAGAEGRLPTFDHPITTTAPAAVPASQPPAHPTSGTSMAGNGLYVVGLDIQPGLYHTQGYDPAFYTGQCYYALLRSTSTTDIIDNNIVTGPATITIGGNVRAVHLSGCQPWFKIR